MQKIDNSCFSFDAYVCSVDCPFSDFSFILEKMGFLPTRVNPKFSYEYAFSFRNSSDVVVLVMFGGVSDLLYISCMGDFSNTIYDITRSFVSTPDNGLLPPRLLRADVKIDFDDASAFDDLTRSFLSLAYDKNIKVSQVGDWAFARDGRTLYVGSRSSVYMVRLYEKFKQSDLYDDVVSGRVRLELEVKPDKRDAKELAFGMDCISLLETSKTYAPLFRCLVSDFSDKVSLTRPRKLSNLETTLRHLSSQYSNTFELLISHCDGDLSKFFECLMGGKL